MSEITSSEPAAKTERAPYLAVFAVTLSLVSIAVAGVSFEKLRTVPTPAPAIDTKIIAAQQEKIAKLEKDLFAARGEIATMHGELSEYGDKATPDNSAALEQSLAEVKTELTNAQEATAQNISRIDEKLAALDAPEMSANARLAFDVLRARVESGAGYKDELARLRQIMPEAPDQKEFSVLEAHQDEGIQTLAKLYKDFTSITVETPDAPPEPEAVKGSWWKQTLGSFKQMVKIERIGGEASPFATLDEAQTLMKLGDVKGAREAVLQLPKTDQENFEEWLDAAQARIDVLDALHSFAAHVLDAPKPMSKPAAPAPKPLSAPKAEPAIQGKPEEIHPAPPVQG